MRTRCPKCGADLPNNHSGKCPICGGEKSIHVSVVDHILLSDSVKYQTTSEFYEENPKMRALAIASTFASAGVGLVLWQPWGGLLGLLFGIVGYFVTPYATTRVREIRHG